MFITGKTHDHIKLQWPITLNDNYIMDKLKPENLKLNNSWCNANVEILNIYVTFIKYNVSS